MKTVAGINSFTNNKETIQLTTGFFSNAIAFFVIFTTDYNRNLKYYWIELVSRTLYFAPVHQEFEICDHTTIAKKIWLCIPYIQAADKTQHLKAC